MLKSIKRSAIGMSMWFLAAFTVILIVFSIMEVFSLWMNIWAFILEPVLGEELVNRVKGFFVIPLILMVIFASMVMWNLELDTGARK